MGDAKNDQENVAENNGQDDGATSTEHAQVPAPTADGQVAETAETRSVYHDERGKFRPGNVGGPGRGKIGVGSKAKGRKAEGEGDNGPMDVFDEITSAIAVEGSEAFFRKLIRRSPTTAAQLLANAQKFREERGEPGGQEVTLLLGDMGQFAQAVMTPPPGDVDGLDETALRAEVVRLMAEVESLQRKAAGLAPLSPPEYKPLLPVPPPGEPVVCPQCLRILSKRRMIQPGEKCRFGCGQWYDDAVAGRETPPAPDPDELARQAATANGFVVTADAAGGWHPVRELSIGGIREALSGGGKKGLF